MIMHTATVPDLQLTHGQLLWTLCRGNVPLGPQRQVLLNELRYLRQLGIPFRETRRGTGRGHRIYYTYEELIELAVGLMALRRGVRPQILAKAFVKRRTKLWQLYREALEAQPAAALEAPWLSKPGKESVLLESPFPLRLHNRYSETPGKIELVLPHEARQFEEIFTLREVFSDGASELLIPLANLVLQMTYWATRAPTIQPGRKPTPQPSPTSSEVCS